MSLHVRFRFDGKCCVHPRYNPENDGRPKDPTCPGCESVFVIWLYLGIARRKAENGEGLARNTETESGGKDPVESKAAHHGSLETTKSTGETNAPEFAEGQTP